MLELESGLPLALPSMLGLVLELPLELESRLASGSRLVLVSALP